MDPREDASKGMKRLRLNSGEVLDCVSVWDQPSSVLEDECELCLAIGGSEGKPSFINSSAEVGVGHCLRIIKQSSASTIGNSSPISPLSCTYDVAALNLTMTLSNTNYAKSWNMTDSLCSGESEQNFLLDADVGLGLTLDPKSSDANSVATLVSASFICHTNSSDSVKAYEHTNLVCDSNVDMPVIDEGSTSNGRYLFPFLKTCQESSNPCSIVQQLESRYSASQGNAVNSEISFSFTAQIGTASASAMSSGIGTRARGLRLCRFVGCTKRARGASGLCIAHGGGRRCHRPGCKKGAEGSTIFCKAHGGGRRCEHLGCTKSAEGKTGHCIAHGGGSRCLAEGCLKAARGSTRFCIKHGGGKRCQRESCNRSAEGYPAFCIAHGGGKRCQHPDCKRGAQGSTRYCKGHGGGKRCAAEGCKKGAEGSSSFCKGHGGGKRCMFNGGGICPKSVHGGTLYCVTHGGGKRCAVECCKRSARGKSDYCVKHCGGKRCKFDECGKSAQGSTDFCKAHGGVKRCMWGQGSFLRHGNDITGLEELFEGVCGKTVRGRLGLCSEHTALMQDHRVHGICAFGGYFKTDYRARQNVFPNCSDSEHLSQVEGSRTVEATEDHKQNSDGKEVPMQGSVWLKNSTPFFLLSPSITPYSGVESNQTYCTNVSENFAMPVLSSQSYREIHSSRSLQSHNSTHTLQTSSPQWSIIDERDAHGQGVFSSLDKDNDTVINMSSLSLPEERVHGGNIMALLSRERLQANVHFY
ncbi:hypothetical protein KP509_29G014200 [Ceratopteris richardii]|uniref:WRKY19-like zinc finger domain-containing protein n=1 Tax=Ceratopteris richardii TaxID=49495 RepID=A0A8T2R4W2_CERRI|nr:hypothetical protein KP509_29G014200 [Ceratopteris richardii]